MKLTGHKTDAAFFAYIKLSKAEHLDMAQKAIESSPLGEFLKGN